ncbi:hypothetical protein WEU32_14340 [Brevundimonas sp. BH3]|uniref:hypothetical protein n=1 Tax=Brevundimonas sp. BH3 TaxID=3133089 RepID=UPI00324B5E0D
MTAYTRTKRDVISAFNAQSEFFNSSCVRYDEGAKHEAARIANAMFMLIGRGMKRHTSICDALEIQDKLQFVSSISENDDGLPLIQCKLEHIEPNVWTIELHPIGLSSGTQVRPLSFKDWWSEVVIRNSGYEYSREKLVRVVRDINGGAHFDLNVEDAEISALLSSELGFRIAPNEVDDGGPVPFVLEACLRQIAEELKWTFGVGHEVLGAVRAD